jgi:hypothetical protein
MDIKVQVRKVGLLPGYAGKKSGTGRTPEERIVVKGRLASEGRLVMAVLDLASLACAVFVARLARVALVVKGRASLGEGI